MPYTVADLTQATEIFIKQSTMKNEIIFDPFAGEAIL